MKKPAYEAYDELKTSESSYQELALVSSGNVVSFSQGEIFTSASQAWQHWGLECTAHIIFCSYEIYISILILKLDCLTDANLLNSCEHLT